MIVEVTVEIFKRNVRKTQYRRGLKITLGETSFMTLLKWHLLLRDKWISALHDA